MRCEREVEQMAEQQQTLVEQVFAQIYELILSGDLQPGGVVNEAALAQRFSVSRGPVREAIQRFHGIGLVTREPFMRARVVSLSGKDLVEIFQLREAVEGMACRLAAKHMPDEEIAELLDDLEAAREGKPRPAQSGLSDSVVDIHTRIARGCGNSRIEQLLTRDLHHLIRLYRVRSRYAPGRPKAALEEHWRIGRALRARDPELAESLMRAHIASATDTLLSTLNGAAAPVPATALA